MVSFSSLLFHWILSHILNHFSDFKADIGELEAEFDKMERTSSAGIGIGYDLSPYYKYIKNDLCTIN